MKLILTSCLAAVLVAGGSCPAAHAANPARKQVDGRACFDLLYAEAFPEDLYARIVQHLVQTAASTLP